MRTHVLSAGLAAFLTNVARVDGDDTTNNTNIKFYYNDAQWGQLKNTFNNSLALSWTKPATINVLNATLFMYAPDSELSDVISDSTDKQVAPTPGGDVGGGPGGGGEYKPPTKKRSNGAVTTSCKRTTSNNTRLIACDSLFCPTSGRNPLTWCLPHRQSHQFRYLGMVQRNGGFDRRRRS